MNPIIIKFGGSLLEDKTTRTVFLSQLAREWKIQQELPSSQKRAKIVLVHGGGKDISKALESEKIEPKFSDGRRITDEKTMEVVEKVLDKINKEIADYLEKEKVQVWRGSGKTDHILQAQPISEFLGHVGIPSKVNENVFYKLIQDVRLPVFYSVAYGPGGETLNVNADDFAQELAIACKAEHLIFMTDSGGIKNKSGQIQNFMTPKIVEDFIADGTITGGMAVKARACVDALKKGVHKVTVAHQVDGLATASPLRAIGTSFILSKSTN